MSSNYLTSTFGLTGRVALITGAAGGLGYAIAQSLGQAGASVVINDLDPQACRSAAERLQKLGIATYSSSFDVSDPKAVQAGVDELAAQGLGIDILVSNAGNQNRKAVIDMQADEWDALMRVHVNGAFNCARAVLPGMCNKGFGRLVLMSSVAGQAAMPGIAAYATAKGAVAAFSRAIAVEYGGKGITCNALAPGFVRTGFTQGLQEKPEFQEFLQSSVPAGRWGEPQDVAPAVVYLASAAGAFVNGHLLAIDGGLLAHM
ncbi:MAG: SDR family NAD(P)-dependent oxidoreductase [Pusillimonas sp.]